MTTEFRILSAERVNNGVLVRFDDGTCVYYSAALLRETAPRGEPIDDNEVVW